MTKFAEFGVLKFDETPLENYFKARHSIALFNLLAIAFDTASLAADIAAVGT